MRTFLTIFVTLITLSATNAQTIKLNSDGRDKDYVNTILERSKKVTDALNITGTEKGTQVLNIVANRYFELNDIYEERDSLKRQPQALPAMPRSRLRLLPKARRTASYTAHTSHSTPTCRCSSTKPASRPSRTS